MDVTDRIRSETARVATVATHVRIEAGAIPAYAAALERASRSSASRTVDAPQPSSTSGPQPSLSHPSRLPELSGEAREAAAAYWLTLNAVNFGSGWFPTLLKMPGMTGYRTVKAGIDRRFRDDGPWSPQQLQRITMAEISTLMMQEPDHPLMPLFKASLRDLGARIEAECDGRFAQPVDAADGAAVALVERLCGWACFADTSEYQGRSVPFLKRAQIAAADLQRAGAARWHDLDRLTLFADNLVPHVLRHDGILTFDPRLVHRIEAGELIAHGSAEEIEYRACALHAVELLSDATGRRLIPAVIDELLWNRGQGSHYKAHPRPRSRCTAY